MSQFSKTLTGLARKYQRGTHTLAKYSGLDPAYVHRLMSGERSGPSLATIAFLTNALFVDEGEWLKAEIQQREPVIESGEYITAWSKLLMAASKDAIAKSKMSRK